MNSYLYFWVAIPARFAMLVLVRFLQLHVLRFHAWRSLHAAVFQNVHNVQYPLIPTSCCSEKLGLIVTCDPTYWKDYQTLDLRSVTTWYLMLDLEAALPTRCIFANMNTIILHLIRLHLASSVAVLAEILLRSPRFLFLFIIKNFIYRIKVSKKQLI